METVKAPDSHPEIILERLIQENQVSLKRLCYLYLHDEDMAEDAVLETFLKMYRSLSDYRGEANERTYLTRMVSAQSTDGLQADIASHTNQNTIKDNLVQVLIFDRVLFLLIFHVSSFPGMIHISFCRQNESDSLKR
jgi:RNA polymerase sigma-70 factor (ECF subfamily)